MNDLNIEAVRSKLNSSISEALSTKYLQKDIQQISLTEVKELIENLIVQSLGLEKKDMIQFSISMIENSLHCKPSNLYTAALMNGEDVGLYSCTWLTAREYKGKFGIYRYHVGDIVFVEYLPHVKIGLDFNI